MKHQIIAITTLILLTFWSCGSHPQSQQPEEVQITEYINANFPDAQPEMNGLYIIKSNTTQGAQAMPGSTVSVQYEGRFLDGKVFDSSYERSQPISFVLGAGRVIQGWEQAIATLRVGEKAELIIPSYLAYGDREVGPIPANTPLAFSVELVNIDQ